MTINNIVEISTQEIFFNQMMSLCECWLNLEAHRERYQEMPCCDVQRLAQLHSISCQEVFLAPNIR